MTTRFALISVWDKKGITNFANCLLKNNYIIISSGGTYNHLLNTIDDEYKDNITKVSEFTGSNELLSGRVKTLHPKIHAGILSRPEDDYNDIKIDTVICNLYPFHLAKNHEESIELIDIGGPTMLRSAAKNYKYTTPICDPNDYLELITELNKYGYFTEFTRIELANKVWNYIYEYDFYINNYYNNNKITTKLKYGTNPHQSAKIIYNPNIFKIINGNPGYINILDALLGWQLVNDIKNILNVTACASYKHNSPAGVAICNNNVDDLNVIKYLTNLYQLDKNPNKYSELMWTYLKTRNCDPLSSFGDFISINTNVDMDTAKIIKKNVCDGIIATGYDDGVIDLLKTKKKGSFIILQIDPKYYPKSTECREIFGIKLIQNRDDSLINKENIKNGCCHKQFTNDELINLILAQITVKYTQSNSVTIAYNGQVIGIGAGQQNRVNCIELAGDKSSLWFYRSTFNSIRKNNQSITDLINEHYYSAKSYGHTKSLNLCLASDGFLPFTDNIDVANMVGVKCIVQPGGSIRDLDILNKCEEYGIKMSCIGIRSFCH